MKKKLIIEIILKNNLEIQQKNLLVSLNLVLMHNHYLLLNKKKNKIEFQSFYVIQKDNQNSQEQV